MSNTEGYLEVLSRGSRALAEAPRFTVGVDALLQHIGEATGASRVWIFQLIELQDDAIVQDNVFEWAAERRYRQSSKRQFRFFSTPFLDPSYRRMVDQRRAGQGQALIVGELLTGSLRRNLERQRVRSMATVPIFVDGQWWGTLGIDDCQREIAWQGPGLALLTVAAELIASAIYRQQLNSRSIQVELFHKVADCGVWELDLTNGELWCSQGLRRMLGYPDTYPRIPLRWLLQRIVREDRQRLWPGLRRCLRAGHSQWREDVRFELGQDHVRWSELVADIRYDDARRPTSVAGLVIDISKRKQSEQRALTDSCNDPLTNIFNRRGFRQRFQQAVRESPPQHIGHALLLLDIDHFKQVNDRYGHPVGDQLLCQLAQRIQNLLREQDTFARLGGEEFAILVRRIGHEPISAIAERIRSAVSETPFLVDGNDGTNLTLSITLSIGVTEVLYSHAADDPQETATQRADQALYAAKHHGRNCVIEADNHTMTVSHITDRPTSTS